MKLILISDTWDPDLNNIAGGLWKLFDSIEILGHNVFVIQPGMFDKTIDFNGYRLVKKPQYLDFILRNLRFDAIHILTEGPLGQRARKYCVRNAISFTTSYNHALPGFLKKQFKIPLWLSRAYLNDFHSKSNRVYVSDAATYEQLNLDGMKRVMHLDWNATVPPATGKFLQSLAFKFEVLQDE